MDNIDIKNEINSLRSKIKTFKDSNNNTIVDDVNNISFKELFFFTIKALRKLDNRLDALEAKVGL